jgi:hypothetical protein
MFASGVTFSCVSATPTTTLSADISNSQDIRRLLTFSAR